MGVKRHLGATFPLVFLHGKREKYESDIAILCKFHIFLNLNLVMDLNSNSLAHILSNLVLVISLGYTANEIYPHVTWE